MKRLISIFVLFLALAACGSAVEDPGGPVKALPGTPPPGNGIEIAALTREIMSLGPEVDPEEAARAARISYEHTYQLAVEYQITDPALIHNVKVNLGLKPRGLCRHWAEDMEKRLKSEEFETLTIHRGIGRLIGVDHSTAIISRRGDGMYEGIVVDPWRKGGTLTWIRTIEDTIWGWEPQIDVLDRRARAEAREAGKDKIVYVAQGVGMRCLDLANEAGSTPTVASTADVNACLTGQQGALEATMSPIEVVGSNRVDALGASYQAQ